MLSRFASKGYRADHGKMLRIEDLFKKNQQLREHQKMLHENVKLLENRLRAGLCDRCTVTQDVAKKKQQDYETSQLHSLQHITILGLQAKVTELDHGKILRIEDLFKKNQQLREHQKMLHENVKLLENRLRAGLCDRCTVTQDVAKKKQQDYETSQLHSLQHITILGMTLFELIRDFSITKFSSHIHMPT
ncbi:UNVERIFIED_CONTAM: hypothetical protein FKN15_039075 [Acipenser sinensis]